MINPVIQSVSGNRKILSRTNGTVKAKYKKEYSGYIIDKLARFDSVTGKYYLYIQADEPVQWEAKIYTEGEEISYQWNGTDDEVVKSNQIQLGLTIDREATKSQEEEFIPDESFSTGGPYGPGSTTRYFKNTSVITWEERTEYKIGKDEWSGLVDMYAPR